MQRSARRLRSNYWGAGELTAVIKALIVMARWLHTGRHSFPKFFQFFIDSQFLIGALSCIATASANHMLANIGRNVLWVFRHFCNVELVDNCIAYVADHDAKGLLRGRSDPFGAHC